MNQRKIKIITGGVILTPFKLLKDKVIFIEEETISHIGEAEGMVKDKEIIDAEGGYIIPGFIDLHLHGGGGFDFMDANSGGVIEIAKTHSYHGTTSFLPTTMTMSRDKIISSLNTIKEVYAKGTGYAEILGVHLEGPYINKERKGAQKEDYVRGPSIEEFDEFNKASGNLIKIVTIAPEIPDAINFIKWLREKGIIASIGHSNATYEQACCGILAGISHVTHIFNAMTGLSHYKPGIVGAALSSPELVLEVIADKFHVAPPVLKILINSVEKENIILITDAIRATDKPEGIYDLGGQDVNVADGQARLENGSLAGSILTMDQAVMNLVNDVGVSFQDALRMATINPAKCLGVDDKKGSLAPGKDADIVILDRELQVRMTMIKGRVVYSKK